MRPVPDTDPEGCYCPGDEPCDGSCAATAPDTMVGVSAGTLARLVLYAVMNLHRQNLAAPPKLNAALVEALVALDLDLDLNDQRPLRRLLR